MNEDRIVEVQNQEIVSLIDYFFDHPIMLIGAGISSVIMGVCIYLERKNSKY